MILGQSAAVAAGMAIDDNCSVQEVNYPELKQKLLEKGQVLQWTGPRTTSTKSVSPRSLPGIVVDNEKAKLTGNWLSSSAMGPFVGRSYLHDNNEDQGKKSALYGTDLPKDGNYSVRLAYSSGSNRATNVQAIIHHAGGTSEVLVNQRETGPIDDLFIELGRFRFEKAGPCAVEIRNGSADGHVIADAVQWLAAEE